MKYIITVVGIILSFLLIFNAIDNGIKRSNNKEKESFAVREHIKDSLELDFLTHVKEATDSMNYRTQLLIKNKDAHIKSLEYYIDYLKTNSEKSFKLANKYNDSIGYWYNIGMKYEK